MILILLSIWASGCSAARLSKGLEMYDPTLHEETAPIGVAEAWDDRLSEDAGSVGPTTITVKKSDLVELVSNYLLHYIHEKIGLNVERVQMTEADSVKLVATQNKVNGIIVLRIKQLTVSSTDVASEQMEVGLTLELTVFNDAGEGIYNRAVKRHYEGQIDVPAVGQSVNELVAAVVKDALKQYVKDPELKKIITKFKYGTVGGVIAGIF